MHRWKAELANVVRWSACCVTCGASWPMDRTVCLTRRSFDQEGHMQFRKPGRGYFNGWACARPCVGHPATHLLEKTISDDTTRQRVADALRGKLSHQRHIKHGRPIWKCADTPGAQSRSARSIHTAEGTSAGTVATLTDISRIRQAERASVKRRCAFVCTTCAPLKAPSWRLSEMKQESGATDWAGETLARITLANRTPHLADDFGHT